MTLYVAHSHQSLAAHPDFAPASDVRSWRDDAACAGMTWQERDRIFFPEDPGTGPGRQRMYDEARSYCARCPVVAECLDDAQRWNDRDGFRGGMSASQRVRLRPSIVYVASCAACGQQFRKRQRESKFCSPTCLNRDHARRVRASRAKGLG